MKSIYKIIALSAAIISLNACATSEDSQSPVPLHNQCLSIKQQISINQQSNRHNVQTISPVKTAQLQQQYLQDNCQMVLGHSADLANVN